MPLAFAIAIRDQWEFGPEESTQPVPVQLTTLQQVAAACS